MKTLLLIVFKIVEIALAVFVYGAICKLGYLIYPLLDASLGGVRSVDYHWLNPYWTLPAILVVLCIGVSYLFVTELLPFWIRKNKEWVNRIIK
jgi:hypothetical protein